MNLEELRQEINQIDDDLVVLLEKRMVCVGQIVKYKEQEGLPVLDQGREREVLEKVGSLVMDEQYRSTIQAQFQDMMKHSRTYQEEVRERD